MNKNLRMPNIGLIKKLWSIWSFFFLLTVVAACEKQIPQDEPEEQAIEMRLEDFDGYYWLSGEKVPLQKMDGKFYIMFYTANEDKLKDELGKVGIELEGEVEVKEYYSYSTDVLGFDVKKLSNYKKATVEGSYEQLRDVLSCTFHWAPYYRTIYGWEIWTENLFFVKLKPNTSYIQLKQLAEKNAVEIVGRDKFLTGWYELACFNLSKGNSHLMANLFYNSSLFEAATASFAGNGIIH